MKEDRTDLIFGFLIAIAIIIFHAVALWLVSGG